MASSEESVQRVLRKMRRVMLEEMPEPRDLIRDKRLRPFFTEYETRELDTLEDSAQRVQKFIQFLEWKGPEVYESFLKALPDYRPSLERKLRDEGTAIRRENEFKNMHRYYNRNGKDGIDEAGIASFNDCGPGPSHHVSHISYAGVQFLSDHLNNPQMYRDFCRAMNIDQETVEMSKRSLNPIACLFQEMSSDPDATMQRLSEALESIGQHHLYLSLLRLLNQ